jgi:hypothetical protein
MRAIADPADHVAPGHVDVVGQPEGDRHGGERLGHRPVGAVDAGDGRRQAGGQHDHLVAGLEHPAGHRARIAPVVVQVMVDLVLRAHDVLHGEAGVDQVAVAGDVGLLEVMQQRRSLVPIHVGRPFHDVVAVQRRDGDERQVVHVEAHGEASEFGLDLLETVLRPTDEIHLVDAHHQVGDAQQRCQEGVPAGLLEDALAGVDEHQRQVGGRGAGDHVARVLDVPRGVGDYELPLGGGEVAVGDVDGDSLLTLRPQAVGQQGQVGVCVAPRQAGALDRLELVLEDRLGVVEQAADERRLAVIHRACGGEAQQLHQK